MVSINRVRQDQSIPSLISKDSLERWWTKALCLGISIESITKEVCYKCPVQYECLWTAVSEDDRIGESIFFIRGGLSANKRQEIWALNDHDPEKTFHASVVEIERAKGIEQAKNAPKQKDNRNKSTYKPVPQFYST